MDNTYIITIENLRTINTLEYTKYVIDISYKVAKTIDGIEGYTLRTLKYECLPNQAIVPFEELTEETVVGWVKSSLTDRDTQTMESSIQSMISRLANPSPSPEVQSLPWAQPLNIY